MSSQTTAGHKLTIHVTSLAGERTHPFDGSDLVGDVHRWAYDHLVKQKDQIPFDRSWIEFSGQRQADGTTLASLVSAERPHREPDLTLALAWDTGGGT